MVTYQGKTVADLQKDFQRTVDDYIEFLEKGSN